jgi:hypothetical protein
MVAQAIRACRIAAALAGLFLLSCGTWGCQAAYTTPGRAADFKAMGLTRDQLTDVTISQSLGKLPLATFPTGIAAVRIQASNYHSETTQTFGTGKYCVITTRDVEGDHFKRIAKLPQVSGVLPLNRLLLPQELNSDMELRQAAANLHADMLLIYTIDTVFNVNDEAKALTVVTLGISPNEVVHMISTASAVLLDTRNGYLYGYAEATEKTDQLANSWGEAATIENARRRAEAKAFDKLVGQIEESWKGVVKTYAVRD